MKYFSKKGSKRRGVVMENDIITIEEVAQYLRVSERTVYDWAQKGEIPAGKIGTAWRFKKSDIINWVNERLSANDAKRKNEDITIKNILTPERVLFIQETQKREALRTLAKALASAPQVKKSDELVTEILKREDLMSTAVGRGIALPHVRLSSVCDLVCAVGICKTPLTDFQTIDDVPVNLLFMIAASYNQHSYYLKTIAYFSAKLKDTALRTSLLNAASPLDAYNLLQKDE